MWIEELDNGKFKYVERYFDDKTGKHRTKSITLANNSPQAKNKAIKLLNKKIAQVKSKQSSDMTFAEAYEKYYDYKKQHWKKSTEANFVSLYKNHVKPQPMNNYMMTKIDTEDIRAVVNAVQFDNDLSAVTARKVKSLIYSVMSFSSDEFKIMHNISFNRIEIKKQKSSKEIQFIDSSILPKEIEKIHELIGGRYAYFIEAQILTGMRFSELAALTKNDWDGDTIDINKAIETANKRQVGATKNLKSSRVIESSERVNEIFAQMIKENDVLFGEKSNLIFANQNNRPQLNFYLNRKLKEVNEDYTTHIMRHTHISLLAEQGFDLKYIMDRVGHTKPDTTLKIYTHVTEKTRKKNKKKLNNLI